MTADSELREVLDTAASAFRGCRTPLASALAAALERPFEGRSASSANDIPVCRFLEEALEPGGGDLAGLLTGLLRQSVFGRLAGYEDVHDAERLSRDPAKATGGVCLDAENLPECPSKRGPITKIMPADGCKGDTFPLVVGWWYNF